MCLEQKWGEKNKAVYNYKLPLFFSLHFLFLSIVISTLLSYTLRFKVLASSYESKDAAFVYLCLADSPSYDGL